MNKKTLGLLAIAFTMSTAVLAQKKDLPPAPHGWHLLDKAKTGYYGISLDQAYALLKVKNLKSNNVIVAVIDSGIDTLHEDLKPVLWTNEKEIPGNGIDDDNNGYIDDVHGWNFLGGKDGRNVKDDSFEAARVYHALKTKWENATPQTEAEKAEYATYERAKEKVVGEVDPSQTNALMQMLPRFLKGDSIIKLDLAKETYNGEDLKSYKPSNPDAIFVKGLVLNISKANNSYEITNEQLISELTGEVRKAESATQAPPNFRADIVKDNEADINDRFYGNNDIMANTPFHGTHCAGIIGAVRNNGKGIDGVADNVRIMAIRAVPDGDEHDKDIALAIRYAVDNGAKVISMSFGKDFSPEKEWVDDAFAYADKHGVLLVHAAGNDSKDIDTEFNFPNAISLKGNRATNLITVGASGDPTNGGITASFSNYGKKEVDVFAPGVAIYSTIPGGDKYGNANGTSMACPVVAGVAALILQYYPSLTPQQVKMAIEKSAVSPGMVVNMPGTKDGMELSQLSKSGGLLNAYEAVKYAATLANGGATEKISPVKKIEVKKNTSTKKKTTIKKKTSKKSRP